MFQTNLPTSRFNSPTCPTQPPPSSRSCFLENGAQGVTLLDAVEVNPAASQFTNGGAGTNDPCSLETCFTGNVQSRAEVSEIINVVRSTPGHVFLDHRSRTPASLGNNASFNSYPCPVVPTSQVARGLGASQNRAPDRGVSRNTTRKAGTQRTRRFIGTNNGDNGAQEDDDNGEDDKKEEISSGKIWACPFCVADPQNNISCWRAVLRRFNDLVQHLKRKHTVDPNLNCPGCGKCFRTAEIRDCHWLDCNHNTEPRSDLISNKELDQLVNRFNFGNHPSDKERWLCLWERLYPDMVPPKSPCSDGPDYQLNLVRPLLGPLFESTMPDLLAQFFAIDPHHPNMAQFLGHTVSAIYSYGQHDVQNNGASMSDPVSDQSALMPQDFFVGPNYDGGFLAQAGNLQQRGNTANHSETTFLPSEQQMLDHRDPWMN